MTPLTALLSLLTLLAASSTQGAMTAQQELTRLREGGANAYVSSLYDDQVRYDRVLQAIGTGEPAWLKLAQGMKPAAENAVAEDLNSALAQALVQRPENVLPLLSDGKASNRWPIRVVCSAPFPAPGKAWLVRYRKAALKAVATAEGSDLKDVQGKCRQALLAIDLSKPEDEYR